ncbi:MULTISPECIES: formate dehydrogenase subunit delta [Burkholderiaceae]|nr:MULTISPECIES: formate dehydrogenase subunit delta [Burkholderiaceae]MCF2133112.1 formate dehydrogenase subunit delta [Mycetohabitans sp. B3]MCG1017738.1 formate dehydrogenase subunit delta [Mycetohabitans sp. B4]MCG1038565.1 formate dehydrogenase subunit delta [Mycetohabitans sp. B7]
MPLHTLVDMVNRIGEFFESMPDRHAALEGIADHLKRFWEPRMRRTLLDALDRGVDPALDDLMPITREALIRYRGRLMPAAAPA